MIEATQFRTAVDVLGKQLVLDRFKTVLNDVERVLDGLGDGDTLTSNELDALHDHLNVAISLGAPALAYQLAEIETKLRGRRTVSPSDLQAAREAMDGTRTELAV